MIPGLSGMGHVEDDPMNNPSGGSMEKTGVRVSIFLKFTIPVVLLFMLTSFLGAFLIMRMERNILIGKVVHTGEIIARNVASLTESAFWSLNWANVEQFLQELGSDPEDGILAVQVVRPDGAVYLANDREVYGQTVESVLLAGQEQRHMDYFFAEHDQHGVLVVHPVNIGKDTWHALVGLSLSEVDAALATWFHRTLIWGAVILGMVMALLLYISRAITRPIVALTRSADRITHGNLELTPSISSRDEIGVLAMQFNRMVIHLRTAHEELQASERRNRALIESASAALIGIALVEAVGPRTALFRYVNHAVCRISGYDRADLLGMPVSMVIHPVDLPKAWRGFRKIIQAGEDASPLNLRCVCKNGMEVPIELSTSFSEYEGRVVLAVFVRDISEKVRAEEMLRRHRDLLEETVLERTRDLRNSLDELKRTQSQLLHAEKMASIGQLAAGIAHEINTPAQFVGDNVHFLQNASQDLQPIFQAYAELLAQVREGAVDSGHVSELESLLQKTDIEFLLQETPLAIAQIQEGIGRISKIVRSMKEFAHPGGQEKCPMDINKALENTVIVARHEWKFVAELQTDFDSNLPMVLCLPDEINQVFLNVLINACQAVRDVVDVQGGGKGRIRISTSRVGDQVEIRISDTGKGIPDAIQGRIFDPFFTTKVVGQGTGQGLAIAHAVVVEQHGGTITFETEDGRGTTFIIRLPLEG